MNTFFPFAWRRVWLWAAISLYLLLALYQLGLPGLHYDEAKEGGVNAMELLTSAPVTAFRDAAMELGGFRLPLMVQDYIGALNVYLALPVLWLTGIGVPNLRLLAVLTGAAALLTLERALSEWVALRHSPRSKSATSISLTGLFAVILLAASPSFVFWSRQGVFVTNLTQPFCLWCLWQGIRWLRTGRPQALIFSALAGGLALYAKLLAIWVIGPFALLAAVWWARQRLRRASHPPRLPLWLMGAALVAFLAPLMPLLLFNIQTGGTFRSIAGNFAQSYYGVDNRAVLEHLSARWDQLLQALRGDHFWYLGGVYGNELSPWLAGLALAAGLWRGWRTLSPPLALLFCAFAASLFTISGLFVTHYALLQPLTVAAVAIGLAEWTTTMQGYRPETIVHRRVQWPIEGLRWGVPAIFLALWLCLDFIATWSYHRVLAQSGGLADHSDATYQLAYYLRYNGLGAPIALDWGLDAPVRYLSQGTVTPIEIFGYGSLAAPDANFVRRLETFLPNSDNVYLLHAPKYTVFIGRRELFMAQAEQFGLTANLEKIFSQRDGEPLFEVWRLRKPSLGALP